MATAETPGDGYPCKSDDISLIARLRLRDESALRCLIDAVGGAVYAKALHILKDPHLANEVAQDTLLILWWEPDRYEACKGSIRSFLVGAARHKAIDLLRHEEAVRSRQSWHLEANFFEFDRFSCPGADSRIDESTVVRAAISMLPEAKREVIYLAYYRDLPYREVGSILEIPESTVKTRIRDSLMRLKTLISPTEMA